MILGILRKKLVNDGQEFQVDIGSAQTVISPEYLLAAHQTEGRIGVPSKINDIAIFDNFDVRKNFVEIGGQRYPRHSVITNYNETDFLER